MGIQEVNEYEPNKNMVWSLIQARCNNNNNNIHLNECYAIFTTDMYKY